jgi:transposase InsO family protein
VTYVRAGIHPLASGTIPRIHGAADQRRERECEQHARQQAITAEHNLVELGCNHRQAADYLKLSPRTLRDWQHQADPVQTTFHPLGRPARVAAPGRRNEVIHLLDELGPGIGLPTLRDVFPELARAALADILQRYRRLWRRLHRQPVHVLHWTRPGSVWAIDFHGPRPPVDGTDPDLLAVRDLACGFQLLWLPVHDVTAATVIRQLTLLFLLHGAPLVLKSDNGSAFGATAVQELLQRWQVRTLFSPPRRPSYNGAIEAGIGSLTSRTEQHASRRGYPGIWTRDDVEAARLEANACSRPRGPLGPSPERLWQERSPLADDERDRLMDRLDRLQEEYDRVQGRPPHRPSEEWQRRATDRHLVSRALVELGYLHYTRRRITPPIPRQKAA